LTRRGNPRKKPFNLKLPGIRDPHRRSSICTAVAAPLPIVNVDTDMIIPKQFLKTIKRTGLGKSLFYEMRYTQEGKELPDFVLNKPAYRKAQILVAGDNFGCGSSREHAPWALLDFGIRCVLATSFADPCFAGRPQEADGRRRTRRQCDSLDRPQGAGDPRARRRVHQVRYR
jgi:hypothetical protein